MGERLDRLLLDRRLRREREGGGGGEDGQLLLLYDLLPMMNCRFVMTGMMLQIVVQVQMLIVQSEVDLISCLLDRYSSLPPNLMKP